MEIVMPTHDVVLFPLSIIIIEELIEKTKDDGHTIGLGSIKVSNGFEINFDICRKYGHIIFPERATS